MLGRYDILPEQHHGRPAYKLADHEAYLYFTPSEGRWYIGPILGSHVACLFAASETATPDLCAVTWQQYNDTSNEWTPAPAVVVQRSQRSITFTDSHGNRRRFGVRPGLLTMSVNEGRETEVTAVLYRSRHGQVSVDGEVSFFMPGETRNRVARRLRSLCAGAVTLTP
jgi:hypothetical protein